MLEPCPWSVGKPLYEAYHRDEWGRPSFDERYLFEMLCLEGQQAGLSWYTVLQKREAYRQAFSQFDPAVVAAFGEPELSACLSNPGLIRHAKKLRAIVANAQAWQRLKAQGVDMVAWLWQSVGGAVQINRWQRLEQIPAQTELSQRLARRLKAEGFQFMGPTTCYAFMQATGMVHDHLVTCPEHCRHHGGVNGRC